MTKPETSSNTNPDNALPHLPHSYPFRLIDRVVALDAAHAVTIKNVSIGEEFFRGHFPATPIMPGVLIVEAMAQSSGLVLNFNDTDCKTDNENEQREKDRPISNVKKTAYLAKINSVKFTGQVHPGDRLKITATLTHRLGGVANFDVKTTKNNDVIVACGELVMSSGSEL